MVIGVGYIDIAGGIDKDPGRGVKRRGDRGGIVYKKAGGGVFAGDGGDTAGRIDAADAVIAGIGNINIAAARVDCGWPVEFGTGCRGAITGKSGGAGAGDSGNDASGADLADAMVAGIGDVHRSDAVDEDPGGRVEFGTGCRGAITGKSGGAGAGVGGNRVVSGIYAADAVVAGIGDIYRTASIAGDAHRQVEIGARRAAAIA